MNHNDITLTYELPNGERVNASPQPTLAIDNQQAKLVDVHIDTNARLILDTDYIIEELTADIDADGERYDLTNSAQIDREKITQSLVQRLRGDWFNAMIDELIQDVVADMLDQNE